jgi:hypothetical protein
MTATQIQVALALVAIAGVFVATDQLPSVWAWPVSIAIVLAGLLVSLRLDARKK